MEAARKPPDPPTKWSEVIDRAQERQGERWMTRLSEIANRAGYPIGHTTLNKFQRDAYPSKPSKTTMQALAYLSGVPMRELMALAESGDVEQPPFGDQIETIKDVNLLTKEDRRVLMEMIRRHVVLRVEISELRAGQTTSGEAFLTDEDVEPDPYSPVSEAEESYPTVDETNGNDEEIGNDGNAHPNTG